MQTSKGINSLMPTQFEAFIKDILGFAYEANDILDEDNEEIISKIGDIIDLCEKTLDNKGYLN